MSNRRTFLRNLALAWGFGQAAPAVFAQERAPNLDPEMWDAPEAIARITMKSAQINVVTRKRADYIIKWGKSPKNLTKTKELSVLGSKNYTIKHLRPGQRYFYQVGKKEGSSRRFTYGDVHSFVTQRTAGDSFSFAVIADSHLNNGPAYTEYIDHIADVADMVANEPVDFVVFAGDELVVTNTKNLVERGILNQSEANQRWAFWRHMYAPILANKPAFVALGNHDGERGFDKFRFENGRVFQWQKWCTIARKQYVINPRHDTYPEGGENAGWIDAIHGGTEEGNASPLENYYAFSWGDALFIVLDVIRYTLEEPAVPKDWTIGAEQLEWLERTLKNSDHKIKFVVGHNIVGGAPYDSDLNDFGWKGRGGAKYAHLGEHKKIHKLMHRHDAQFFLYGHDHIFSLSDRNHINYVCCGKARKTPRWTKGKYWTEVYGDTIYQALPGYTVFNVEPESVTVRYKFAAFGEYPFEKLDYEGRDYAVENRRTVNLDAPAKQIARIWAPNDSRKNDLFEEYGGTIIDYKVQFKRPLPKSLKKVKAMFVGQETFTKKFKIK